jgi:hypothetical protein
LSSDQDCAGRDFSPRLSSIVENAIKLVKAGLNLAENPQILAYRWYFQDQDVQGVKRVLEGILERLSGQGDPIFFHCVFQYDLYQFLNSNQECIPAIWSSEDGGILFILCPDPSGIGSSQFCRDEEICHQSSETPLQDELVDFVEVKLISVGYWLARCLVCQSASRAIDP